MINRHPDVEDYLEELCRMHSDLLHQWNGRSSFARLRTDEHIKQISLQATQDIVVVASVNGQRIGHLDDQQLRRGISLIFASRSNPNMDANLAIQSAMNKAEKIMFDFVSKMEKDQVDECGINFDLENITWDEIEGPWLDNYYGWMLYVPFKGYLPGYNEDSWTGVPSTDLPSVLKLIDRFRVGVPGAPMADGDSIYTNSSLQNGSFLMLADGKAIHQLPDDQNERFCTKQFNSDTITVNGTVTAGEVIEIYKISSWQS